MGRSGVTAATPAWARLKVRTVAPVPWATVQTAYRYGAQIVRVLSIGRGWVSVVAEAARGPQAQVWRPTDLCWGTARLLPGCTGIVVELGEATHRCVVAEVGEPRVWQWVERAIEVEAGVEGVLNKVSDI